MTEYKYNNKLLHEKSPYLLQHAHNPVDWYPWGDEAFNKAKEEDKPVFLSIGYSTCHWCHVMEKESFEDEEVAKVLNDNYVSIKVDREERPDIDSIYMSVCQAITGSGGWPLTIIMTPEKKPFFAGTYFPKSTQYGHTGIIDILNRISKAWNDDRSSLTDSGDYIVDIMRRNAGVSSEDELSGDTIRQAYKSFLRSYDSVYGGFNAAPKFPSPHNLSFLLMYYSAYGDEKALEMVKGTLKAMYAGGIFDHIGFGFSRYSTDRKWLVPHFEKMLYDNALLAYVYTECYKASGDVLFKDVAEKIFSYILRDMTSPEGGFYSAEDADSEGVEGKFYLWTLNEIKDVLGSDADIFCKYYNITSDGNYEGRNIPNLIGSSLEDVSSNDVLKRCTEKLFAYREKRVHPYKDDKILTAWNGLMIAALSYAGRAFGENRYIESAERTIDFIYKNLRGRNGRLMSRYRNGDVANIAYLDDYAYLVWGLIETFEAVQDIGYLEKAVELNDDMFELFNDENGGGLFLSGRDGEKLIFKSKDAYDGAMPSGNSAAAMNSMKLFKITGDYKHQKRAYDIFNAFGGDVKKSPYMYSRMISAFLYSIISGEQIVISGDRNDKNVLDMLSIVNVKYRPYTTVILNDGSQKLHRLIPFTKDEVSIKGRATAYVCRDFACSAPTCGLKEFEENIK